MDLPEFLTRDRYGEIRLAGHRIGLYHVVFFHKAGDIPEGLVERFPSLPLPLVRDVIAFYRANQAEVDAYVAECQAEIDRQRAGAPKAPSLDELRGRIRAMERGRAT